MSSLSAGKSPLHGADQTADAVAYNIFLAAVEERPTALLRLHFRRTHAKSQKGDRQIVSPFTELCAITTPL